MRDPETPPGGAPAPMASETLSTWWESPAHGQTQLPGEQAHGTATDRREMSACLSSRGSRHVLARMPGPQPPSPLAVPQPARPLQPLTSPGRSGGPAGRGADTIGPRHPRRGLRPPWTRPAAEGHHDEGLEGGGRGSEGVTGRHLPAPAGALSLRLQRDRLAVACSGSRGCSPLAVQTRGTPRDPRGAGCVCLCWSRSTQRQV